MTIPSGFAQCNLRFGGIAAPLGSEVVLGINQPDFGPGPIDVAEVVADHWVSDILPLQSSALVLQSVLCKFGPDVDGPSAEFTVGTAGGAAATTVPPNVALLVRKNTASGGRKNRGRMFVPGIVEGNVDQSGDMDGTVLGNWQTALDDFLDGLDTAQHTMVLLHGDDTDPTTVTSLTAQVRVATQRRRLR